MEGDSKEVDWTRDNGMAGCRASRFVLPRPVDLRPRPPPLEPRPLVGVVYDDEEDVWFVVEVDVADDEKLPNLTEM